MGLLLKERSKTFEDLLATDGLFIEFFNQYLELPTFPEPLCFNSETAGFEVKTGEKRRLAREIKAAVRAGKKRKKIYRPVHNHSYSAIPLIPIEEQPYVLTKEINTSFTVQTLNKEQGIQWIKLERLPAFLLSDCYIEYRLAKLVSQAQIQAESKSYVLLKLDHRPPPPPKRKELVAEEPEVDIGELMLRQCFVCMGNAPTTDTEQWVSQAKLNVQTTITSSSQLTTSITSSSATPGRPQSGFRPGSGIQLGRPTSAASISSSRVADSGIWSPSKSMFASSTAYSGTAEASQYSNSIISADDEAAAADDDKLTPLPTRTPRPSDIIFEAVVDPTDEERAARVYTEPKPKPEEIPEEIETESETDDEEDLLRPFSPQKQQQSRPQSGLPSGAQSSQQSDVDQEKSLELTKPIESPAVGGDQDSDEDLLLNSDEDYEDERDDFFHKKKNTGMTLLKKKGIEAFKKFLSGSTGEKHWLFWMDIERSKGIDTEEDLQRYMVALRERYYKSGAPFELAKQTKRDLGLTEPSQWTREKLCTIHSKVAEPLVMYWAPRFLLQQKLKAKPEENPLYRQQRRLAQEPQRQSEVYPNPPTISMLPLRPKSCMPRMTPDLTAVESRQSVQITDAFEPTESFNNYPKNIPKTTPLIGMRRNYQLPEMFQPPPDKKEEKEKENAERRRKSLVPKYLIKSKPVRARPPSAPAKLGGTSSRQDRTARANSSLPIRRVHHNWGDISASSETGSRPPSAAAGAGSRRSSVGSSSSAASTVTSEEFAGGRRMEGLLQALDNENKSGQVMRKFLRQAGNKLWTDCLMFWEAVQVYHRLFYSQVIDPFTLQKKAKEIHAAHIVSVGRHSIRCSQEIRENVHAHLVPPYEELFDEAEEHALTVLFDAWTEMLELDLSTFDKVELIEEKRHLDTKSKYMVTLQRRGIIKDRPETPEENAEDYKDPIYDETIQEKVPEEFKDWSLEKMVHNRLELEHFRQFLADNYASMDLLCWMDIEAFKRLPHTDEKRRDLKARDIKAKYFNKKYFFGPNSPAGKAGQEKVMAAGGGWGKLLEDRPPTPSLLEAQRYVRERIEKKWLPLFLATETFTERQHVLVNMDDAVEDVMIQRKKKSQAIWKMLESKWVSSSKDIITFRKALLNPVTSAQFRKYISMKGDNFENDVLFWQEVQKYKDLCHMHSDRALIQQKTFAVINCFIDSPIPPSLQVDITQDMADRIVERKLEASPYLFREAQLTVFRVLFSQWSDFCAFRSKLAPSKMNTALDRHKRKHRADAKRKQRDADDKKQKEEAKRKALGLPPSGEQIDEDYDPFAKGVSGGAGGAGPAGSDDEEASTDKAAMSWSYSKYMKALDCEEVLNEVDLETFSSLTGGDSGSEASGPVLRRAGRYSNSTSRTERKAMAPRPPTTPAAGARPFSGSTRSKPSRNAGPAPPPHSTATR